MGIAVPSGATSVSCSTRCGTPLQSQQYKDNDPKLQEMCNFNPSFGTSGATAGDYTVSGSGQKIWIVNVGEAVGGIFAAMGIMVVAFILLGVGSILACVGCC